MPTSTHAALPSAGHQVERLVALGLHQAAGLSEADLRRAASSVPSRGALLAIRPTMVPASRLAPLLERAGKPGFVVTDMNDVDEFAPISTIDLPDGPLYWVHDVDRGDQLANWTPDEALPALADAERTPLLLTEGMYWLLHQPEALERGRCFMTIGSRLRKPGGALDARTPALWISNGTGRDGAANREAPKVGWCWAGNRHTWLGFASTTRRTPA